MKEENRKVMDLKEEQLQKLTTELAQSRLENQQIFEDLTIKNEQILEAIKTITLIGLQPQDEKIEFVFNFPSQPDHFSTLLKMQDFQLQGLTFEQSLEDWEKIGFKMHFKEFTVAFGNEQKVWGKCTFNRRIRYIEMTEQQKLYGSFFREIFFYDANHIRIDGLSIHISAFPLYLGKTIEIPDGYELIGLAYAADSNGHPHWLNFNIWQPPRDALAEKLSNMRFELTSHK